MLPNYPEVGRDDCASRERAMSPRRARASRASMHTCAGAAAAPQSSRRPPSNEAVTCRHTSVAAPRFVITQNVEDHHCQLRETRPTGERFAHCHGRRCGRSGGGAPSMPAMRGSGPRVAAPVLLGEGRQTAAASAGYARRHGPCRRTWSTRAQRHGDTGRRAGSAPPRTKTHARGPGIDRWNAAQRELLAGPR